MKRIAIVIVGLIIVVGAAAFALRPNSTTEKTSPSEETQSEEQAKSYTLADVSVHSDKDDCWTVIDGGVYDITSYVKRHPGGDKILMACGTDATSLFKSRQTEDGTKVGTGTPHSSVAERQLNNMKIGTLGAN